ncbi:NUDIX hydrolase [Dactylosporangium cerinum]
MAEQLAVGAVVRRGKDVLLVSETLDGDLVWALPGGAVGPGEPLLAKVAQEAGFTAVTAERLLWIARYTAGGAGYEMFGFEVTGVGPHDGSGSGCRSRRRWSGWGGCGSRPSGSPLWGISPDGRGWRRCGRGRRWSGNR